jgi:hypothetical protein
MLQPDESGRHLVSPPNWPTKDVMLVVEEMGYAPDLRGAVRSALEAVLADGKGRYDIGVLGEVAGKPIGQ